MRTRSSSSAEFLEERDKKRSERKERELQNLLNAAGVDRPDISAFTDSPVTTRLQSKGRARSQLVEVVLYSPAEPQRSRRLSGTKSQAQDLQGVDPRKIKVAAPEPTEITHQDLGNDCGVLPGAHSTLDPFISKARPEKSQSFVAKSLFVPQGRPGARKKRILLKDFRKAIQNQKKRSTCRFVVLDGLNKALKKLDRTPRELLLKKPRKPKAYLSEVLRSLKPASKELQLGQRSDQLSYPPLSQDSSSNIQGKQRAPGSPTAEKEVSGKLVISKTSLDLSILSVSPIMGTQSTSTNGASTRDHEASRNGSQKPEVTESPSFPLTKECKHYTHISQVDWDIQKYWHQRNSIFSRYNEGIRMTYDAWFGVTPEPVANKVAIDFASFCDPSKTVIIDMFAGAGGNTIAFALSGRWTKIVGIEKDPSVIACAQHNAAIYGVADQITWMNDDSFSYLANPSSSIDVTKTAIFASPPWGGPGYRSDEVFNLNTMHPYSVKKICRVCKGMDSALYLPRTSDLRQIASLAPEGKKAEVVQYCMEGASKALVAYIPAAAPAALS